MSMNMKNNFNRKIKIHLLILIITLILVNTPPPISAIGFNNGNLNINTELEKYLIEDNWDFLGRKGEKIYFKERERVCNNNPFKEFLYDVKHIKYQLQMTKKCYNDNWFIYVPIAGIRFGKTIIKPLDSKTKSKLLKLIPK